MKLTLIQTAQNRPLEVARFVKSLNAQEEVNLELLQYIFLDQGNHRDLFENLSKKVDFLYLHIDCCSLSHARNVGLRYAKGDYVCYPDDDCWYEPNTLSQVFNEFKNCNVDGVVAKGVDQDGNLTNLFPEEAACLTKYNRCGAISYTIFMKLVKTQTFDEHIGVGTQYGLGAGEETDYILRLMSEEAFNIIYNPNIIVHHPSMPTDAKASKLKIRSYSRGGGYLLKKHHFPFLYVAKQFVRPLVGTIYYFLLGRLQRSAYSYNILKGRLEGFFFNTNKFDAHA